MDDFLWFALVFEKLVQFHPKFNMQAFITWYELITKCQTRHKTTFLQPENRTKRSWEENTLDANENKQTRGKILVTINMSKCPICFLFYCWYIVHGCKKITTLILVFNVGFDESAVSLRVNLFHCDLKWIECTCFWYLNFCHKALSKIFHDDTVTACEKSENILNEEFIILVESLPLSDVLMKIYLFKSPKRRHMLFVEIPEGTVSYWEDNKTIWWSL